MAGRRRGSTSGEIEVPKRGRGSAGWRRRRRRRGRAWSTACSRPTPSGRRCSSRRRPSSDPHRIAEIQTRLADIGAHSAPARAASILSGLGFDAAATRTVRAASSPAAGGCGWRSRRCCSPAGRAAARRADQLPRSRGRDLARGFSRPIRTRCWCSATTAACSNRSVDAILHLEKLKLTLYRGGYDDFEDARRARSG